MYKPFVFLITLIVNDGVVYLTNTVFFPQRFHNTFIALLLPYSHCTIMPKAGVNGKVVEAVRKHHYRSGRPIRGKYHKYVTVDSNLYAHAIRKMSEYIGSQVMKTLAFKMEEHKTEHGKTFSRLERVHYKPLGYNLNHAARRAIERILIQTAEDIAETAAALALHNKNTTTILASHIKRATQLKFGGVSKAENKRALLKAMVAKGDACAMIVNKTQRK